MVWSEIMLPQGVNLAQARIVVGAFSHSYAIRLDWTCFALQVSVRTVEKKSMSSTIMVSCGKGFVVSDKGNQDKNK
jgi:hypothetical protein